MNSSHLPTLTRLALHALMAFFYLVTPWIDRAGMRRAQARIDAGDLKARTGLYASTIFSQVATVAAFAALIVWGHVPARAVGLGPPRSWAADIGLLVLIVAYTIWSGMRMRARATEERKAMKRADALVPRTNAHRAWYAAVSLGSGVEEEFVCRGFAFFYLHLLFPGIGLIPIILLTAIGFGVAHLYQGWKGIGIASAAGAVFAVIYWASGDLLLPVALHSLDNFRLVFLPPKREAG